MYIQEIKNEHGATVYHVEDEGCIQEFWTKEQAQEYIDYVSICLLGVQVDEDLKILKG
jgi:hypothetical protein|tara:strand:- start:222 stop:395 length:174 start_codon:yes stop_codon:yes gene_type:complete